MFTTDRIWQCALKDNKILRLESRYYDNYLNRDTFVVYVLDKEFAQNAIRYFYLSVIVYG